MASAVIYVPHNLILNDIKNQEYVIDNRDGTWTGCARYSKDKLTKCLTFSSQQDAESYVSDIVKKNNEISNFEGLCFLGILLLIVVLLICLLIRYK